MNGFEILPSAGGGSDPLKLDLAGGTMTGQLVLQLASATGALNISPTWNNGAITFAGIYMRATNTASGASSKLIDLGTAVGGSLFTVDASGATVTQGVSARYCYLGSFSPYSLTIAHDAAFITLGAFNDVVLDRPIADTLYMFSSYGGGSKLRIGGDNATRAKYLELTHNGTNAVIFASSGSLHISSLPTSNPGPGILWNNAGTPAIGT